MKHFNCVRFNRTVNDSDGFRSGLEIGKYCAQNYPSFTTFFRTSYHSFFHLFTSYFPAVKFQHSCGQFNLMPRTVRSNPILTISFTYTHSPSLSLTLHMFTYMLRACIILKTNALNVTTQFYSNAWKFYFADIMKGKEARC